MEKSRSLFQQVIGHKMLFFAFLFFGTDILAEVVIATNVTIHVNRTANVNISTSPFPESSKTAMEISMPSLSGATTPDTLSRNLSISEQTRLSQKETPPVSKQELQSDSANLETTKSIEPKENRTRPMPPGQAAPELTQTPKTGSTSEQPTLPFKETSPVSKQELQSTTTMNPVVPENASSPMPSKVSVSTKEKHTRTEATEVQESKSPPVQKEVPSKMNVTSHFDSETVSSSTKDLGTRSQGIFEQSANTTAYLETTKSIEPKEDRTRPMPPGQAAPELTQTPKTGSYYTSGPFTTLVTYINNESISDERPSEKKHSVIILAVVFTILLVVGLLVFLCLRRRRHSGSTSFNSPEWAGQATLPDDTGLDKDGEQQGGSVGEGETRRGTLVTFFGKRQSRVPSIAMEDVSGKGGKEETEQLLCREAEIGSPSEAIGDANGKVPEPLKGSSQESQLQ